jgi:hypothetical protein
LISSGVTDAFDSTAAGLVVSSKVARAAPYRGGELLAMRRIFAVLLPAAAVGAIAVAGGCSTNGNGAADASIDGFGVITPPGEGGGGESGSDGPSPVGARMRLAHASPDLGPTDFCWRLAGAASFTGPVLSASGPPVDSGSSDAAWLDADAGGLDGEASSTGDDASPVDGAGGAESGSEGGTPGALTFGEMTADVQLSTSGTFDIALVAPGTSSCHQAHTVGQVTIDAGKRATAVLMGLAAVDAGPSMLTVVGFTDSNTDPQNARVRFIHAALGSHTDGPLPALSVHAGQTTLAPEVEPGKATSAATAPAVDAQGYADVPEVTATTALQIVALGDGGPAQWATQPWSLGVRLGSVHTGILASQDQGGIAVIWCGDALVAGGLAACVVLSAPR